MLPADKIPVQVWYYLNQTHTGSKKIAQFLFLHEFPVYNFLAVIYFEQINTRQKTGHIYCGTVTGKFRS